MNAPKLKPDAVALVAQLSQREREVLVLVGQDLRNKEIAERLGICLKAVEKRRERVVSKVGANTPVLLAHLAIASGLVENFYRRVGAMGDGPALRREDEPRP